MIPKTPTLSASPSNATIASGTSVTLTCATASSGNITYTFLRDTKVVNTGPSATHAITTAKSDSGTYTCVVTISFVDSVVSSGHAITVVGKFELSYRNITNALKLMIL